MSTIVNEEDREKTEADIAAMVRAIALFRAAQDKATAEGNRSRAEDLQRGMLFLRDEVTRCRAAIREFDRRSDGIEMG